MHITRIVAPLVITLFAAPALAQGTGDKVAAEALFDQGKKLLLEGKYGEACPKLAESNRLDAGIGTMLYLADCYEKSGQTASAWAQFREAASAAARAGDAREKIGRERAARLEPKLSKLSITVNAGDVPGLEVKRDGELVGKAMWATELPIDPGTHTISATAPGKNPWQTTVQVAGSGALVAVSVPPLENAPATVSVAPVPAKVETHDAPARVTSSSPGNGQRVAGYVIGGVGIVGLGVGAFFGLQAKSHLDDSNADNHCHDGNHCDPTGVQARSDAQSAATLSTIAFIAGGAAVAGGAILVLTAPKSGTTVGITPSLSPREAGLTLRGAF